MPGAFSYGMTPTNSPKGSAFQAVQPSVIPVGVIEMFAGSTAPNGWLICNGSTVSRKTYSDLFKVIGTTYGVGNSNDTFTLPDMRGRTPIGVGTGSGLTARTLGSTVGTETVTLDSTQIPAHSHPNTVGSTAGGSNSLTNTMNQNNPHGHNVAVRAGSTGGNFYRLYDRFANESNVIGVESTDINHTHNVFITNANNTGGGGSHNNMQPSIGLNYIIKT